MKIVFKTMNLIHYKTKPVANLTRYILLCLGMLMAQLHYAQKKFDKKQFIKDSIAIMESPRRVRIQMRIDNRQIFFKREPIAMYGFDAGVLIAEKLRLTLGYHWLDDKLDFYRVTVDGNTLDRRIKMKYASINAEFIYKNTRYFSLGMPLEIGFGENQLVYKSYYNNVNYSPVQKGFVLLTDFGLSATYKPLRWIGVKGFAGYRKTLSNGVKDFHFDGFFVSIGLNADLRELLKDFRMYKLKRRYKRGKNLSNAVDLITD